MKDEHHLADTRCSQSRLNAQIAPDDCDTFNVSPNDVNASSVILYNTNTLPLYPAPVGRRLDWTFVENDSQKGAIKTAPYPTAKEPPRSRTNKDDAIGSNPRSLTLDLLPDDVHACLSAARIPTGQRARIEAAPSSSTTTTMSTANPSNSRSNTLNPRQTKAATSSSFHHASHQHTTATHSFSGHMHQHQEYNSVLGLYGWQKKCLFVLILGLLSLIVTNLALTLWILKVMEFSADGMGSLKVVTGGLQLSGQALVLDMLKASTIRSRQGQPISIESSKNFTVNTRDWEGRIENQLFLGHDRFDVLTHNLKMFDSHGAVLLSADKNEVRIGANVLRLDGEGGVVVRESVQTAMVRAEAGRELKFESPTRSLHMNAGQDILIKSAAGSLDANCLNDIRLHSEAGSIRLDSPSILMPNLKTAQPAVPGGASGHLHSHKVYQLCVCANGKLFMAQSHSVCAGDEASVCR